MNLLMPSKFIDIEPNILFFQSTSNYIARKYGVRAAMPGFIAKKLCPKLVIVPCNFKRYEEVMFTFKVQ